MNREEALKKGYLQEKIVRLKPVTSKGGKMISDKNHSGYFMWDQAVMSYSLRATDRNGNVVNPFKDELEKKYFEETMGMNLNPYDPESKWYTQKGKFIKVDIQKTQEFMFGGMRFDLSNPEQNLQYRVLVSNKDTYPHGIALSPDEVNDGINYKFMLVADGFEDTKNTESMDIMQEIYTYYGSIKENVKKLRDLLGVYLVDKKSTLKIPNDASKEWLVSELNKAFKSDSERVYKLIMDPDLDTKIFIDKAIRVASITRTSMNSFTINDEGQTPYSYPELLIRIKQLQDSQDGIYVKIGQLIKNSKL